MAELSLLGLKPIAKRAMGSDGVVMPTPSFDQGLVFNQGVEDLPIRELVTHRTDDALAVAILPLAVCAAAEHGSPTPPELSR